MNLRALTKSLLNALAMGLTAPLGLSCRLEWALAGRSQLAMFHLCSHCLALGPGTPGLFLRRAFYRWTLDGCSPDCHIGFGTLFTQPGASIDDHAYIGAYALIGNARIRAGSLIGSRVSLLSGGHQHVLDSNGRWSATDSSTLHTIEVGANVWIGEGAILMANVGDGAMVAAGAVVSAPVPKGVMVAGNPARFVKKLRPPEQAEREEQSTPSAADAARSGVQNEVKA